VTHMLITFSRRVDVGSACVDIHVRQSPKTDVLVIDTGPETYRDPDKSAHSRSRVTLV